MKTFSEPKFNCIPLLLFFNVNNLILYFLHVSLVRSLDCPSTTIMFLNIFIRIFKVLLIVFSELYVGITIVTLFLIISFIIS